MELKLLSVNIGKSRVIGERDGKPLYSAIAKKPIDAGTIFAGALGLDGDTQANKLVHGGVDKAVYAYASDNWPWWQDEQRFPCAPGSFGENLTLAGGAEDKIHIGDRFLWGDAELEVSQPRSPCEKFQIFSGRNDAGALMTRSGRSGWYFRVAREGIAPVGNAILMRSHTASGPTLREAFFAGMDRRTAQAEKDRVAAAPALSAAWRKKMA